MGICCSTHRLDVEDLIAEIFKQTNLPKFEAYELENKLKDLSFNNRISCDDFNILILSKLYSKDMKYANYLDKIMEAIIPKDREDRINIYVVLLALYPMINNHHSIENLFKIFENTTINPLDRFVKINTGDLQFDDFVKNIEVYLTNILIGISRAVVSEMERQKEENFEFKEHMALFTDTNCKKYTSEILESSFAKKIKVVTFEQFEKFFKDKMFLFNITELRLNFLEFVRNNNNDSTNHS
jgi:hypothetical protein